MYQTFIYVLKYIEYNFMKGSKEIWSSCIFIEKHYKEEIMKIKWENNFIQNPGLGHPGTCVYQLIFMMMIVMTQKL